MLDVNHESKAFGLKIFISFIILLAIRILFINTSRYIRIINNKRRNN